MSQTTHYNLNKPTGSNLVNPLVDTFPNWDIVDTEMYKNYNLGVSGATETVSQGVHAIVRTEADLPFFKFTAVANFSTGDTFTLDGVSVNVYTPDGLALKNGAFVSGATIIGYYNSSNHSITLMLNTTSGAVANSSQLDGHDASYFAKASDIVIIGDTNISAIGDGTLTGGLSAVDTKANDNNTHIGNLASLTTTDKDSTVDAINEVNASVTQLSNDLSALSMTPQIISTSAGNTQMSHTCTASEVINVSIISKADNVSDVHAVGALIALTRNGTEYTLAYNNGGTRVSASIIFRAQEGDVVRLFWGTQSSNTNVVKTLVSNVDFS